MTRSSVLGICWSVAALLAFAACGGNVRTGGGNGGTSAGGDKSTGRDCVFAEERHPDGASLLIGCNHCRCNDGAVVCEMPPCADGCTYGGKLYSPGQTFAADDGCNSCSCEAGGLVTCTEVGCATCEDAAATHAAAVEEARRCDPQAMGQCTIRVPEGLRCSCDVFVNADNGEAIAAAKAAASAYASQSCGSSILCGACALPASGYCSAEGRCEVLWQDEPLACKVGGVVYPSGATGIPDPNSCNECTCVDGGLSCTKINCPKACPAGQLPRSDCASCGPRDACLIVEHGCLPTCSLDGSRCAQGICWDGVCSRSCL